MMLSRFALNLFTAAFDVPAHATHRIATDKRRVNQYQNHYRKRFHDCRRLANHTQRVRDVL